MLYVAKNVNIHFLHLKVTLSTVQIGCYSNVLQYYFQLVDILMLKVI